MSLAAGHTISEWHAWDWNLTCLTLKPVLFLNHHATRFILGWDTCDPVGCSACRGGWLVILHVCLMRAEFWSVFSTLSLVSSGNQSNSWCVSELKQLRVLVHWEMDSSSSFWMVFLSHGTKDFHFWTCKYKNHMNPQGGTWFGDFALPRACKAKAWSHQESLWSPLKSATWRSGHKAARLS